MTPPEIDDEANGTEEEVARAAFGEENRTRLIARYFSGVTSGADLVIVSPRNAWWHVYRLLLWIDSTTGLAHCYESDKSQPGRPWYARSLRFHDWLTRAFLARPIQLGAPDSQPTTSRPASDLGSEIDWLFREASAEMAPFVVRVAEQRRQVAAIQRAPYEGRGFPEAGLDPELVALLTDDLGPWLREQPPDSVFAALTTKIHAHLRSENNRRNLLGEGFEDVLAAVLDRTATSKPRILKRPVLHDVGGFAHHGAAQPTKFDLALIHSNGRRSLVSAKWSIRSDREKQFLSDYQESARLENMQQQYDHVAVTNEFDPARVARACERQHQGRPLFTHVVHVNPDALIATYDAPDRRSQAKVLGHIRSGRLLSLEQWLLSLCA